jgi:hypothetical protein
MDVTWRIYTREDHNWPQFSSYALFRYKTWSISHGVGVGGSLVMKIWKVKWYSVFRKPFIVGPLHDLRTEHVCPSGKFLTYILKCLVRILTGTQTILKHTAVFLGTVKLIPLLHFNNSKVASSHVLSYSLFLIYQSLDVTYFQSLTAP